MDLKHYIFHNGAIEEASLLEWAIFMECCDRHVAETTFGEARVSTVFLGLDQSFSGIGPPVLFETMIFSKEIIDLDDYQRRYRTIEEARRGHSLAVERLAEFHVDVERVEHKHECGAHFPDHDAKAAAIRERWSFKSQASISLDAEQFKKMLERLFRVEGDEWKDEA
jgi:hypothetical protein